MDKVFEEISEHVNGLAIVDTHEHLAGKEESRDRDTDVLKEYLTHYFNRDLISAGLDRKDFKTVVDPKLPLMERWKLVEPHWEASRYTGYGRSLDISVRALYGIDGINRSTIEELNRRFLRSLEPGHYRKVLKEKSNIRVSLLDSDLDCDRTFFRSVYRPDHLIYPKTGADVQSVEEEFGIRICRFEDWLEACEALVEKAFNRGAVALKSALAYERTLRYERVTRREAEEGFNVIFTVKNYPDWESQVFTVGKSFQDYLMHFILHLANRRRLTFQFHTGIQEGNGNIVSNSDPSLLSNLFLEYPDVDFDLFHIGYPYQQVVSVLAKNFPNVFIDMCWAHIVSPEASVRALIEWLDCVPFNKISAFGGDYCFVDGIYGHQCLARRDVSAALARKVADGVFDSGTAKEIARMLFYENPIRIFKLPGEV